MPSACWQPSLGAVPLGSGRCLFRVWAPRAERVDVHLLGPADRLVALEPESRGYHAAVVEGVEPGALYRYRLAGEEELADPVSRSQPQGVHGPSEVIDLDGAAPTDDAAGADAAAQREAAAGRSASAGRSAAAGRSASAGRSAAAPFPGIALEDLVFYELHVGTFTPAGTFEAVIDHLDDLAELGVTALELMPVAQFPGERNWGYDGVFPFAPQDSYGGPAGLRALVQACHRRGLAVILDVVYNHLGPEGARAADYGPYFTDMYRTPWGQAVNLDGPGSDEVRRYFIENALQWVAGYGMDGLRLDALHALIDRSALPFLGELADAVHGYARATGRHIHLIAESDANDARLLDARDRNGMGLDGHWNDDLHHALHAVLTGERDGYYQSFGGLEHLATALAEGYVYGARWSPFRRRRHGSPSSAVPARRLLAYSQNHDQVGNRPYGERLSALVPFEALKLAAATVILSPYLPLLFMGEEYGETAPFLYFIDHGDPGLVDAVRRGRTEEFAHFPGFTGERPPPDPQDPATFEQSKLDRSLRADPTHRALRSFYRELLSLRRTDPALAYLSKEALNVENPGGQVITLWRREPAAPETDSCRRAGDGPPEAGTRGVLLVLHLGRDTAHVRVPLPAGPWRVLLDSSDRRWAGPGSRVPPDLCSAGAEILPLGPFSALVLTPREEDK